MKTIAIVSSRDINEYVAHLIKSYVSMKLDPNEHTVISGSGKQVTIYGFTFGLE